MSEFVRVAGTADVAPGSGMVTEANGQSIALFNVAGTFYAIDNDCVHRGGPLGEGELVGETVSCPWHNWQYDVKTGRSLTNPSACVKSYQVKVNGADVTILL
ncbi:MAG: Rieske 2Fe-2S domain-containing protein [Nitrospira sp.]|nr:Rieske 2Fe-2S domain-containing protein [Nitrospira sp.]